MKSLFTKIIFVSFLLITNLSVNAQIVTNGLALFKKDTVIGQRFQVPNSWNSIVIDSNVTISGGFYIPNTRPSDKPLIIEGRNRKTSVITGTGNFMPYPANQAWEFCSVSSFGSYKLTLRNFTSKETDAYSLEHPNGEALFENLDIINTINPHNCDGIAVGNNSVVKNCYIKVKDDAIKLYQSNVYYENIIIDQFRNGAPLQLGWGGSKNNTNTFKNLTINGIDPENRYNLSPISWKSGSGVQNIIIDGFVCKIQGEQWGGNGWIPLPLFYNDGGTLNVEITNAAIKVSSFGNTGNGSISICGSTEKLTEYNCISPGVSVPGIVEAEEFTASSAEIETEETIDAGGGDNIKNINKNSWVEYDILPLAEGDYIVEFRIASETNNIDFEILQGEKTLCSISSTPTGGSQTWKTDSAIIKLKSGSQKIRVFSNSDDWKLNWINFKTKPLLPNVQSLESFVRSDKSIILNWNENIENEVGFIIERSTGYSNNFLAIDTTAPNIVSYLDSTDLSSFTLYAYRIRTLYSNDYSQATNPVKARTKTPGTNEMPSPWTGISFGDTLVAMASASFFENDTFTIDAGDGDFWSENDRGHFIYQPLAGDCEIIAKISDFSHVQSYSMAGVMIRDSIISGSKHAFMALISEPGAIMRARTATNGTTSQEINNTGEKAPYWVRLKRVGNRFTGSVSADKLKWKTVRSVTIEMSDTVYVGMAASSHTLDSTGIYDFTDIYAGMSLIEYTLSASASTGGNITPSGNLVLFEGQEVNYVITPDNNYIIQDVLVDDTSVGKVNNYTFSSVSSDHTIKALFQKASSLETNTTTKNYLFPNPQTEGVNTTIKLNTPITDAKIVVSDIMGKIHYQAEINNASYIELKTSDLPAGNYIIKLNTQELIEYFKLIIK